MRMALVLALAVRDLRVHRHRAELDPCRLHRGRRHRASAGRAPGLRRVRRPRRRLGGLGVLLSGASPYGHVYEHTQPPGWPVPYPPLMFLAHLPGYLVAGKDGVFYAEAAFSLVTWRIFVGLAVRLSWTARIARAGGLCRQRQHRLRRGRRQHRDQLRRRCSWWPSWPPPGPGTGLGRSTRAHRRAGGGAAAGHEAVDMRSS